MRVSRRDTAASSMKGKERKGNQLAVDPSCRGLSSRLVVTAVPSLTVTVRAAGSVVTASS